jgi:hypothetical protein
MRHRTTLEIISHLRKFLQLPAGSGVDDHEEVSNGSALQMGERDTKDTVHYFVHLPVHSDSGTSKREKKSLRERGRSIWPPNGRYVGWSDPTSCARGVPNGCVESLQPTRSRGGQIFGIEHEEHESASRPHLQFGGR